MLIKQIFDILVSPAYFGYQDAMLPLNVVTSTFWFTVIYLCLLLKTIYIAYSHFKVIFLRPAFLISLPRDWN